VTSAANVSMFCCASPSAQQLSEDTDAQPDASRSQQAIRSAEELAQPAHSVTAGLAAARTNSSSTPMNRWITECAVTANKSDPGRVGRQRLRDARCREGRTPSCRVAGARERSQPQPPPPQHVAITDTELNVIAALAKIGLSRGPKTGCRRFGHPKTPPQAGRGRVMSLEASLVDLPDALAPCTSCVERWRCSGGWCCGAVGAVCVAGAIRHFPNRLAERGPPGLHTRCVLERPATVALVIERNCVELDRTERRQRDLEVR
jgi:hypothetical protein